MIDRSCQTLLRGSRKTALLAVVAASAVLVLAACTAQTQPASSPTATTQESQGDIAVADFVLSAYQGEDVLGGEEVRFSSLFTQGKPVVLNFWAGLCPPCRAEMPEFQEVYQEYKGRVLLVGLDIGPFIGLGSREDGQALLKELQVTYPAGTTFEAEVVRDYEILAMPTTFFIEPNGEVVRKLTGLLTKEKMVELVEELLAASATP